jgi:hypothetical protein
MIQLEAIIQNIRRAQKRRRLPDRNAPAGFMQKKARAEKLHRRAGRSTGRFP